MKLPGIVTNVTAFGAFVDIGVHQDGLVHISQLANRFVKNPSDVVKVGQNVRVSVMDVDLDRNRISLSMKPSPETPEKKSAPAPRTKNPSAQRRKNEKKNAPFHNPFAELLNNKVK